MMIAKLVKLSAVACLVSGCVHALAQNAYANEPISVSPIHDLKFEISPEGVGFAQLQGNRFKESYMAMVRLPAGLDSPPHAKSANMFGVIISGAMTHTSVNAKKTDSDVILTAGSFYKIPAGVAHISRCVSDVECVTFLYQDGKFDFNVVTE